ncbi:MAG: DNA polymerase IV [Saprospiraceae bacterium]|nr:DNA polymerase IV [Saprospiraceae bacterium]
MYHRAILHLDLDSFFVSVECLKNSDFLGKPLLIGGTSNRGVVASCSYEARRFGVHSAMPMKMALRLCPQAIVLRGDMDSYSKYSSVVTDIVSESAPVYEKASIDEFYLDLTGMDKHFGCFKWSSELRDTIIRESGLPISFGLSVNKTVSKVGTGEAKPNGTKYIPDGAERGFLAPLPVKKIPGVGDQTHKKLNFMGVRTIETLSQIPVRLLEREFGKPGRTLWERANAIDPTPIVPYHEQKSMSKERTFTEDTLDITMMKNLLLDMSDKLSFELRAANKLASVITVKIRYADFNTFTKQKNISYTANDRILGEHVLDLFDRLYERRQLIRLIGVRYSGLVQGNYQINLFDDTIEHIHLMQQMDRIRRRFGADAIMRASGMVKAVYINPRPEGDYTRKHRGFNRWMLNILGLHSRKIKAEIENCMEVMT